MAFLKQHVFALFAIPKECSLARLILLFSKRYFSKNEVFSFHLSFNSELESYLTVSENIAFGLDVKKINPILKKKRIQELLTLMQLEKFGDSYPSQLSGGQRQRVALARALAVEPKVLLLDEPFAALDAKIRKQLRSWLRELHHQISVTTVFVTHDHSEAMELAQEIVILENGKISQIGSAQELSDHPTNMFVRTFLELEKTPSIE